MSPCGSLQTRELEQRPISNSARQRDAVRLRHLRTFASVPVRMFTCGQVQFDRSAWQRNEFGRLSSKLSRLQRPKN